MYEKDKCDKCYNRVGWGETLIVIKESRGEYEKPVKRQICIDCFKELINE